MGSILGYLNLGKLPNQEPQRAQGSGDGSAVICIGDNFANGVTSDYANVTQSLSWENPTGRS